MSEDLFSTDATADAEATAKGGYPTPLLRFMPAINFGVRAAALAGLAVSAGAIAIGLAGAFDDVTAAANTTCCKPD
ncbi:MAG: hypothetical protein WBA97_31490 [Actinophytocola sp.]|uniref:hypothetical protein n=1 Tax=Actinophytocola sp. TaxID=1872138 RepID=UPI003C788F7B